MIDKEIDIKLRANEYNARNEIETAPVFYS